MENYERGLLLFISLLLLSFSSFAQNVAELGDFEKAMKPGTVLTYDVKLAGKSYQLFATIKKLTPEMIFEWKTSAPANKSGSVTMSANALAKGDALHHEFTGGETKLESETSLWLSKKMQDEVMASAGAALKVMSAADTVTALTNTISETGFVLNGNFVTVPGWELEGGSEIKYLIGVIESTKFPLIYRLDIGWTMLLTEVKAP